MGLEQVCLFFVTCWSLGFPIEQSWHFFWAQKPFFILTILRIASGETGGLQI